MQIRLVPARTRDLDPPSPALARGIASGFEQGAIADLREALSTLAQSQYPPPWGAYWGLDERRQAICGVCGFKGQPDADGRVEIAYFTFPRLEGRGVAAAMALSMVEIAASEGARAVLAHTLPVANASGAVLTRIGFALSGIVEDPEDGEVWRWRLGLS